MRTIAGLVLAGLWMLGGIFGQDDTRTQSANGVSLKLPPNWEWAARYGDQISVRMPLEIGERKEEVIGELFCTLGDFVGTRIDELNLEAKSNPADHKKFKIKENQKLGSMRNVVTVSYIKERGTDPVRLFERCHWIFRHNNILYEWREEWPEDLGTRISSALSSVQKALTFTAPVGVKLPDPYRDYPNQRVKYKPPLDWVWTQGEEGQRVETQGGTLFGARSEVLVKGERLYVAAWFEAIKTDNTERQALDHNRPRFLANWKDVKNEQIEERIPFQGDRAMSFSFTGVRDSKEPGTPKEPFFIRYYFFKHKGHICVWQERAPARGIKDAKAALQQAQKGLYLY
jgi:hypothetical protein